MYINERESKNRNCIFYLLNTSSHYNSTFKIAKELKERGFNPIYVGGSNMRRVVEMNGFKFFEYSVRLFCINKGIMKNNSMEEKKATEDDLINYKQYFTKGGYFDEVINRFNPVVIFLDVSKIGFFPELFKKKIKFVTLSTKVNLNKEPYIPPYTSSFIPIKKNIITKIICEILWLKIFIFKKIDNLLIKVRNRGFSLYELPFEYLKSNELNILKHINFNRVSNFGLNNIPEIILSPQEFDFPDRKAKENQIYMGPSVYIERNETIDIEIKNFLHRKNLIYCSMGSYDIKYQLLRIKFINKLVHAFSSESEYNTLISIGNDINLDEKFELPTNILICHNAPQLEVLKHSSIMITHGGMQSITESILYNVPLIVYPLNQNLDQKGNAARVKFHNVGIIGNIKTDTPLEIIRNVNELISNEEIINSMKDLRDRYIKSKNFKNGMEFIEDYISNDLLPTPR